MIASTVALLLVSAGFVTYECVTFRQTLAHDLSTLSEVVGNQSTAALTYRDKEVAQEILNALRAEKHIVAAALYDANGHLLASYAGDHKPGASIPARPGPDDLRFESDALVLSHKIQL